MREEAYSNYVSPKWTGKTSFVSFLFTLPVSSMWFTESDILENKTRCR